MARLLASSVTLVAAVLAACGGEEPDLPADAAGICATVATRFEQIQAEPPRSFDETEQQLEAMIEIAAAADAALPAPDDSDPAAFERYRAARAAVTDRLRDGLEAVRGEDPTAYRRARAAANRSADRRRRLARAAGLPDCAERTGLS